MNSVGIEFQLESTSPIEAEVTEEMLTAEQVALRLSVHINTVKRWSNLGILRSFRVGPGREMRFLKEHVDKFIRM